MKTYNLINTNVHRVIKENVKLTDYEVDRLNLAYATNGVHRLYVPSNHKVVNPKKTKKTKTKELSLFKYSHPI